jgi:hypothetical protein
VIKTALRLLRRAEPPRATFDRGMQSITTMVPAWQCIHETTARRLTV